MKKNISCALLSVLAICLTSCGKIQSNTACAIAEKEPLKKIATSEMEDSLDFIARTSSDAIATWYVQQQIDSTTNEPFISMSYVTAWDSHRRAARAGLTFSQTRKNTPILAITLPTNAYTERTSPLIYFYENITDEQPYQSSFYSIEDKNLLLFGDDDKGNLIMLSDNFLEDMLNYRAMRILYMNNNAKKYDKLSDADLDECLTQIVVELEGFHQQYPEAYKWLKTQTK